VGLAFGAIFTEPDAEWYLKIAQGNAAATLQPFLSRPLGPLVARGFSLLFHSSLYSGFYLEASVSIVAVTAIVGFILVRCGAGTPVLLAVGALPFWPQLFNSLVLPDLLFAALLSIFLLLLFLEKHFAAALMLLPLYMSRESTLLVLFCLLIAGWRVMGATERLAAILAAAGGMGIVKALTPRGVANREHVGALTYLAGKIPWNFMKNVAGFPLWSNTNRNCREPLWQIPVHTGGMNSIGICSYSPSLTLRTAILALASFGLLPLLLLFLHKRSPGSLYKGSVFLRFSLLYGMISFLLAPLLGASVPRLFGYAWPLFLLAVPILAVKRITIPPRTAVGLIAIHLAVAWSTALRFETSSTEYEALLLAALVGAYSSGWVWLRRAALLSESAS